MRGPGLKYLEINEKPNCWESQIRQVWTANAHLTTMSSQMLMMDPGLSLLASIYRFSLSSYCLLGHWLEQSSLRTRNGGRILQGHPETTATGHGEGHPQPDSLPRCHAPP